MSNRLLLLLLSIAAPAFAQEGVPAPSNVTGAQYPRILPDNSVIFRIKADNARKVTIGEYELTKSVDGFWTVRTKALCAGLPLLLRRGRRLRHHRPGKPDVLWGAAAGQRN